MKYLKVAFSAAARKFQIAAGACVGVAGLALADGKVTAAEAGAIGLTFLGALGVFAKSNNPPKEG